MKDKYINLEKSKKWKYLILRLSLDGINEWITSAFVFAFGISMIVFLFFQPGVSISFSIILIYSVFILFALWCILGVLLMNVFVEIFDHKSTNLRQSVVQNLKFYNPEVVLTRGREDLLILKEKGPFNKWNHYFIVILEEERILINRSSLTSHGARSPFASIQNYFICRRLKRNWTEI